MKASIQLRQKRDALVEQAGAIVDRAVSEARSISREEDTQVLRLLNQAESLAAEIAAAELRDRKELLTPMGR